MHAFKLATLLAISLSACAAHDKAVLTETSASDLMPTAAQSRINSKELGLTLGSGYTAAQEHLLSAGWTAKQDCLAFTAGDSCIAEFQRGHEVAWLFLTNTNREPVISGVSLMQCFDCER